MSIEEVSVSVSAAAEVAVSVVDADSLSSADLVENNLVGVVDIVSVTGSEKVEEEECCCILLILFMNWLGFLLRCCC